MDQAAAKQQIVDRVKQANNILVTVSNDPPVDQLASCIGMTLFLNKLKKHATAVFSGEVPSTLEFLQPEKTIERTTDSLRDFIISLDKAKADKLRYKVEDKFVRIYITPYKTSLSEKDLVFSEGDFNIEVVLALGVRSKSQLDAAISQHGRILHDATIVSINHGQEKAPDLGQINWQDSSASSLCEMLVSISEAFGTGLIDSQMATAFLTGIVSETERFSNLRTSPKVMTMSAQLMAAGANQQLIISKLEPPGGPEAEKPVKPDKKPPSDKPPRDTLHVPHDDEEEEKDETKDEPGEVHIDEHGNILSDKTPAAPEPPPPPKPHALLDPNSRQPSISSPFTADTEPDWYDFENAVPIDPLSESQPSNNLPENSLTAATKPSITPESGQTALGLSKAAPAKEDHKDSDTPTFPTPALPSSTPQPIGVDNARSAVSAALSGVPFNPPEEGAAAALNVQPSNLDGSPPAGLAVPSKSHETQHTAPHKSSKKSSKSDEDRPAPPPVPPPLPVRMGLSVPTHSAAPKNDQASSPLGK